MAIMQLTVIPLGTSDTSIGDFVADCQKALASEGCKFKLTDMGTIIEGPVDELLQTAAKIHALPFSKGVERVITQISIDDRRDKIVGLDDKIASVQKRL